MAGKANKSSRAKGQAQAARPVGPMVALYGLDAGTRRGDAVRAVMAGLGIRVRTIAPADLNDLVGAVAGLPGMRPCGRPYEGPVPDDEFMLVGAMPGPLLDELLAALRANGASVAHKAQLTAHNRLWPVRVLMEEVAREHAAMTARSKCIDGEPGDPSRG